MVRARTFRSGEELSSLRALSTITAGARETSAGARETSAGAREISAGARESPAAEALETEGIAIDRVIEIVVPEEEILSRLSGRRVHEASGRVYHVINNPPETDDIDDVTGEPLIQRDDDREDTIRERLRVYRLQTKPLVEFYKRKSASSNLEYHAIEGSGEAVKIRDLIFQMLNQ